MWEVQRILTALKRKQRNLVKMKSEKEKKEQEELQKLIEEEKYALIEQVNFEIRGRRAGTFIRVKILF